MNNTNLIVLASVASIFGLVVLFAQREFSRGQRKVEAWCARNQYLLLSARRGPLYLGPLFMAAPNAHRVYRIEVADSTGERRAGYADFRQDASTPHVTWDR